MERRQSTLKVIEIFPSIQGESTLQGLPTVFIRLSGCNLRCRYCDTAYAYSGGTDMSIPEISARVRGQGISRVCLTGGEPLLQAETPELIRTFLDGNVRVSVETNGSLDAAIVPWGAIRVIDVKCPGSGEVDSFSPRNLTGIRPSDEFKFVLCDRTDFEYARSFVRQHHLSAQAAVLLSPVWEMLTPDVLAEWIVREMPEARLSLQLHKCIWPNESRGR